MKILILDDDEMRHKHFKKELCFHDLTHVYTSKECIQKLSEETFDCVFLDHDLGGQQMVESGENTGYEVCLWLRDNPDKRPKQIIIHTMNPVGRQNMLNVLPESDIYKWF